MLLTVSGCFGNQGGYPPVADLQAVIEEKPQATEAILTDPVADALYNASIESWGDRISSAGGRLCRFFKKVEMPGVDFCPTSK